MRAEPALELGGHPHGENDGDDGARVAGRGHDHGDAQERAVVAHRKGCIGKHGAEHVAASDVHHRGIGERNAQRHADELARVELLGRGVTQDNRQEVEEAVTRGVEHLVGAVGRRHEAREGEDGKDALDHTGGTQAAEDGLDDAGDEIDQHREGIALLGGRTVLVDLAETLHTRDLDGRIVDVLDHVDAYDDLVLAVGVYDLDDTRQLFYLLGLRLRVVAQLEAQPRHAMRDALDVGRAAYKVNDLASKLLVRLLFACAHTLLFSLCPPPWALSLATPANRAILPLQPTDRQWSSGQ